MSRSFIFPGQGSQYAGMGCELADSFTEAREIFESVDESLKQNLSKLMFEGPEEDLNLTENTQPALMAVSMAVVTVLEKQGGLKPADHCAFMAGHSLGEYAALTAAGALSIEDTAKLLKLRGQAMQRAVPVGEGAMAAILGLDLDNIYPLLSSDEVESFGLCKIANDNCPGQIVISGLKKAVEVAARLATENGAKRAVMLPVSAPFHCALMQPAADEMAEALAEAAINAPKIPIICNVTAQGESDPDTIRDLLVEQVTGMVRWRESVLWMRDQGVAEMIELGAGKVLSGLIRRIDKGITVESVGTPEQVEALIAKLG